MLLTPDQVVARAQSACRLDVTYKLGAGGRSPTSSTPANAAGACDCSGFVAWAFGLDRRTEDPLYLRANDGWIQTDAMVTDAFDIRGLFDIVRGPAQPGDVVVFGKGRGRKYGHTGIVTRVVAGKPLTVVHCSGAHAAPRAIRETGPEVFERAGAIVIRRSWGRQQPPVLAPGAAWRGRMSTFGGPNDPGVSASEGLALWGPGDVTHERLRTVLLPRQPPGTTGLARRLNPNALYVACRWDYRVTPRAHLRAVTARVTNVRTGKAADAIPTDWGPHERTGRVADLSPGLARVLGLETDDECMVTVPVPGGR